MKFGRTTGILSPSSVGPAKVKRAVSVAGSLFTATITSNQQELNLATWATSQGWKPNQPGNITVNSGVYIWSNNTANAALTTGSWQYGLTLVNNGYIMGMGGNGTSGGNAFPGGAAINLVTNANIINLGYIAGGGGGGAGWGGLGGGGAGGGLSALGNVAGGAPGQTGLYGAGGRILPGTGGASVNTTGIQSSTSVGANGGGAGGGGSAYTQSVSYLNSPYGTWSFLFVGAEHYAGAGGGGWGAKGGDAVYYSDNRDGNGNISVVAYANISGAGGSGSGQGGNTTVTGTYSTSTFYRGGTGGSAIQLNNFSVTWQGSNTGAVYGNVS